MTKTTFRCFILPPLALLGMMAAVAGIHLAQTHGLLAILSAATIQAAQMGATVLTLGGASPTLSMIGITVLASVFFSAACVSVSSHLALLKQITKDLPIGGYYHVQKAEKIKAMHRIPGMAYDYAKSVRRLIGTGIIAALWLAAGAAHLTTFGFDAPIPYGLDNFLALLYVGMIGGLAYIGIAADHLANARDLIAAARGKTAAT